MHEWLLKVFLVIGKIPDMTRHLNWISSFKGIERQHENTGETTFSQFRDLKKDRQD